MFLRPARIFFQIFTAFVFTVFFLNTTISAQTHKPSAKQTAAKKPEQTDKKGDAKKDSAKDKTAKDKTSAKDKNQTSSKNSAKETAKNAAEAKRKLAEKLAADRRAEEQRQQAETARRQAEVARQQVLLEQKRRREQVIQEARARKIAFERGLREQTVENIANDNTEGEDLQVRRAAINALGSKAGMVVVMEAQTGKILTIVNQDWAVRQSYRPCSTIKLVTGVAGLNESVISEDGYVGNFRMNLDDALAYSNNAYFQNVGVRLGNTKVISYAKALGLGEPTGINMDGEAAGKLPYNNSSRLIYSHGDGYELSPLQLAVLTSEITNGGKTVVPQIPRTRIEQANFHGFLRRQINLPLDKLTGVIPGMIGSAEYGTAHRGVDASMGVAGKTGSCIDKGSWLGLFTSVAPIENPKYAVVVITRGQSERGKYAAAVAGRVYDALRSRLLEGGGRNVALTPYNQAKPHPKLNEKTAAKLDGGEEDETDAVIENEDGTIAEDRNALEKPTKPITSKSDSVGGYMQKSAGKKGEDVDKKSGDLYAPVVIKIKKPTGEPGRARVVIINK